MCSVKYIWLQNGLTNMRERGSSFLFTVMVAHLKCKQSIRVRGLFRFLNMKALYLLLTFLLYLECNLNFVKTLLIDDVIIIVVWLVNFYVVVFSKLRCLHCVQVCIV